MDLKPLALRYFSTFSRKDTAGLKALFCEDVSLRDWEISASGISNVLAANQKIFDSVRTIEVRPTNLFQDAHSVCAELEIWIDGKTMLLVLDILDFDAEGRIRAVRAFRGN